VKIIDIRMEIMDDDLFDEAWNVARRAAHGIREDGFAAEVFDASEEADP
jgi:hypothetical protein